MKLQIYIYVNLLTRNGNTKTIVHTWASNPKGNGTVTNP